MLAFPFKNQEDPSITCLFSYCRPEAWFGVGLKLTTLHTKRTIVSYVCFVNWQYNVSTLTHFQDF